jgi:medium-chain acyl-[acyl-carrier-protein] hydrolase
MDEVQEENLISTTIFEVTSAETDMEARLRMGSLVGLLIQSAIKSADKLGFGFQGIQKQQLFWVLSRLSLEIYRPIKWYEKIEVETWPKNVEKILYLRDYVVRDHDKTVVARATSGWLAIDFESHRAKKIDGIHAGMLIRLKDRHGLQVLPTRLDAITEGEEFEFKTSYFDIDLNKHLSAPRYIDRMMDTFPVSFHKTHYPETLSVNFMKETMLGESLRFIRQQTTEKEFVFEAVNAETGANAFRGKIGFGSST